MNNLLLYLAESSLALLMLYLVYVLLLSRQTCFGFNRFYLLSALFFSFVIPFMELPTWPAEPVLQINTTAIALQPVTSAEVKTYDYGIWLYGIYAGGLLIAGIICCRQFLKLYTFIYSHSTGTYYWENIKIIPTHGEMATFSFLHYILYDNSQPFTPAEKEVIFRHEQAHLLQKHSFDILFIKLISIIFWFNPLLYFYKNALESTHEYLADAQVLKNEDADKYTTLLVQQVFCKTGFSFGNFFHLHKSLTLKRITMMKKTKNRSALTRPLLTIPLVCALALIFASNQSVSLPKNSAIGSPDKGAEGAHRNLTLRSLPAVQDTIDDKIFTFVEQNAAFPGGDVALNKFIKENLKYPAEAKTAGTQGLVVAQFVVDKKGKIKDVKVVKSLSPETDAETIRVIKLMPDFAPARQNGKPVSFRYTMPVRFGL
jgi:TonB family protein